MLAGLRRGLFDPLDARLTASPRVAYRRELERTQFLEPRELLEIQRRRLVELAAWVWRHNRFYRRRFEEAGLRPEQITSPSDLKLLPPLTKAEIRANLTDLISDGYRRENLLEFKTGGSTGRSLALYITEECSERRNACARRHDRWTGWNVGEPVGALWGSPVLPRGAARRLRQWLTRPTIYLDTMDLGEESVRDFADRWRRTRPTLLFGHAHSLYMFARIVDRMGIREIQPRGIVSTSMMLIPRERQVIESVFGVPATDRYGSEEVSLIASECERHDGMHLNVEHLVVEFLDDEGRDVAPGQEGQIVVTDLMNRAMPFLRYRAEDVGVPSARVCPCGRGLPLMERVVGRTADFLVRADGGLVAGVSLIERTLLRTPGIEQMQLIQTGVEHLQVNAVKAATFRDTDVSIVLEELKRVFGVNTRVDLHYVPEIPPESSGKYRFSICRIPERAPVAEP